MDSLSEQVIPLLMEELDPHSVYIPRSAMEAVNEPLQAEFDGIGASHQHGARHGRGLRCHPFGAGRQASEGQRPHYPDRRFAGGRTEIPTTKLSNGYGATRHTGQVIARTAGNRGTSRGRSDSAAPVRSKASSRLYPDGVGYIELSQFAITSAQRAHHRLEQPQGTSHEAIDLRPAQTAIRIANEFLPADKLIVYTEDETTTARMK